MSKYALRSLAEAQVATTILQFLPSQKFDLGITDGFHVSLIQPGNIDTPIADANIKLFNEISPQITPENRIRYHEILSRIRPLFRDGAKILSSPTSKVVSVTMERVLEE